MIKFCENCYGNIVSCPVVEQPYSLRVDTVEKPCVGLLTEKQQKRKKWK